MLKRTILIENKSPVTMKNQQLVVKTELRERTIPIEDIGFLVLDHAQIYSLISCFLISS
jgi:CRISPR-associated protein Cas1